MFRIYRKLYTQFVIAARYQDALLQDSWKEDMHHFVKKALAANYHQLIEINSLPDHMHVLMSMRPSQSIHKIVAGIKAETEGWIKMQHLFSHPFRWQEGHAAFLCTENLLPGWIHFIRQQDEFHKNVSFIEEQNLCIAGYDLPSNRNLLFAVPGSLPSTPTYGCEISLH